MSNDRYKTALSQLAFAAVLIEEIDLEYAMKVINQSHSLGPILDPTKYIKGMQNLQDAERLVSAGMQFQKAVEPLLSEAKARKGE